MSEQGGSGGEEPRIIVDSDWKKQAQAEKERLAQQESQNRQQQPAQQDHSDEGGQGEDANRPIEFMDVVRSLASQALLYLGAYPDPESGKAMVAPDMAKAHIDMLGTLQDKTRGNLTEEEEQTLNGLVNDLRMQFVEVSKAVAKAVEEGKISSSGEVSGGLGGAAHPGAGQGGSPGGPQPGPGMSAGPAKGSGGP